jgi:hypothetical protein
MMMRKTVLAPLLLLLLTLGTGCSDAPGDHEVDGAATAPHADALTASSVAASVESVPPSVTPAALEAGWAGFLAGLGEARRGLEDPALFPAPPTDRNLAEGYRYLLGHLARLIEAQTQRDPRFPYFQRSVRMLSKWTIDNPDTLYLSASISAEGSYRIRGRTLDTREWRDGALDTSGPRAPRVVIFQTTTEMVGDTGELAEMRTCRNQTLDSIDQFELEPDAEGRFEILIAAERPEDYEGHFLTSRREMSCPSTPKAPPRLREATQLNVREIFSNWNDEIPLELEISRLDMLGAPRPPRTSEEIGHDLAEIGRKLGNQIKFWNALHELGLEVNGDRNGDGRLALPLNGMNPPAPPFIAGGTAGAGQLYSAGTFELAEDEALVVRVEAPIEPHYIGFQLGNLWGESTDQRNYLSSATDDQNPVASDGARYYIVSARDPGTPGWVDTTGLEKGTISMRFIFRENPPAGSMPTAEATLMKVADVRSALPADTTIVTEATRLEQVDARQRHIQRRWRQY